MIARDLVSFRGWYSASIEFCFPDDFVTSAHPHNTALIILSNSAKSTVCSVCELLATIDAFEGTTPPKVFVVMQGTKTSVQKRIDTLLKNHPKMQILYDETGRLDGQAMIPSTAIEVELEKDEVGLTRKRTVQYAVSRDMISAERQKALKRCINIALVRGCMQVLKSIFGKRRNMTIAEVRAVVRGMSEGRLDFPFSDSVMNEWREWIDDEHHDGIHLEAVAGLASCAAIDVTEEQSDLLTLPRRIEETIDIWDRAIDMYGLPVKLDLSKSDVQANESSIARLAGVLGMGSLLDAADAGVPMSDLFA